MKKLIITLALGLLGTTATAESKLPSKACKGLKAVILDIDSLKTEFADVELLLRDVASQGQQQALWVMSLYQERICQPGSCLSGIVVVGDAESGQYINGEAYCKQAKEKAGI
jgi:hypothetical protein